MAERLHRRIAEQTSQARAQGRCSRLVAGEALDPLRQSWRESGTTQRDQRGALAWVRKEAQRVVDGADVGSVDHQEMGSLAIRVVDQHVEQGDRAELRLEPLSLLMGQ